MIARGRDGDDLIQGSAHHDPLYGDGGDRLYGGPGDDLLNDFIGPTAPDFRHDEPRPVSPSRAMGVAGLVLTSGCRVTNLLAKLRVAWRGSCPGEETCD